MRLRRKRDPDPSSDVLFDATKVDIVAESPDGTTTELYIVADAPWTGSDAQIRSLQDKIHAYVSFALDGQMAASYSVAAALPWCIVIRSWSGPPDDRTADVIARTVEPVRGCGGDLVVKA